MQEGVTQGENPVPSCCASLFYHKDLKLQQVSKASFSEKVTPFREYHWRVDLLYVRESVNRMTLNFQISKMFH